MAKITERIIESLGGVTAGKMNEAIKTAVSETAARAYEAGYSDGNDEPPSGTLKSYGYREYNVASQTRKSEIPRADVIKTAVLQAETMPIADRVLKMKRDHIVGDNVTPQVDDDDLGEIMTAFWKAQNMGEFISEIGYQMPLFGNQCIPAFVRKADGRVQLGYIDPEGIEGVITHPGNVRDRVMVVTNPSPGQTEKNVYRIIKPDADYIDGNKVIEAKFPDKLVTHNQANIAPWELATLKEMGLSQYTGSAFYGRWDALTNDPFGRSDLATVSDSIDQADDTLFALGEREQFAGYFSFDVGVDGDDNAVQTRSKEIRKNPPKRGSVNVHNLSEKWDLFAPNLQAGGSIEIFRGLLGYILGGKGFPVHWYGFGDDANRATAVSQGTPTQKSLSHEQGTIKKFVLQIMQFVADQAEIASAWKPPAQGVKIDANFPEIVTRDMQTTAQVMQSLAAALQVAVQNKWITQETAAQAWQRAMAEFGVDYDAVEEAQAVEDEQETEEEDEGQAVNDQLVKAMANGANNKVTIDDEQ